MKSLLLLSGLLASATAQSAGFGGIAGSVPSAESPAESPAGASSSSSTPSTPSAASIDLNAISLHSLAVANGLLFFGTATDTSLFNDTAYMQLVNDRNLFGLLVPENSQKWQPTEPTQDAFQFANPDSVRSMAATNQQMFRCHTLTWFQQLPTFITTTAWTRATLTAAIQTHIANVVGHFRGQCYSWDVVNEALNDNGTFRTSVFFNVLGTDFIPLSFQAAAAADPQARLYYNDFSLEFNSSKTAAALAIVGLVRRAGQRIDGVGFQGHMVAGQTPSRAAMAAVLRRFTSLNLEVAITELDVRVNTTLPASGLAAPGAGAGAGGGRNTTAVAPVPPSAAALQQQASDYASMVGACVDVDGCVGVVVWEFTDKYSWIPSTFPGSGAACLFDDNMAPKPAYTAVASVLAAQATGLPAGAAIAGLGAAAAGAAAASSSGGSETAASTGEISSSEFIGNFGGTPGVIPAGGAAGSTDGA